MMVRRRGARAGIVWPVALTVFGCGCLMAGCQLGPKPGTTASSDPPAVGIGAAGAAVRLTIRPGEGTAGDTFTFALTGAKPGETVLFEILHPDGTTFIGSPHTAASDGTVTTTYSTAFDAQAGPYKVLAAGNQGTVVHTTFGVDAPPPSTRAA